MCIYPYMDRKARIFGLYQFSKNNARSKSSYYRNGTRYLNIDRFATDLILLKALAHKDFEKEYYWEGKLLLERNDVDYRYID